MFKRGLISFLGLPAAGILLAAGLSLILPEVSCNLAASEPALKSNPNGPYYEGPVYFGFSDFSADGQSIEDKLISAIRKEALAAHHAGLTPDDKDWPAGAIYVVAYSFTNKTLANALAQAAEDGCSEILDIKKL